MVTHEPVWCARRAGLRRAERLCRLPGLLPEVAALLRQCLGMLLRVEGQVAFAVEPRGRAAVRLLWHLRGEGLPAYGLLVVHAGRHDGSGLGGSHTHAGPRAR